MGAGFAVRDRAHWYRKVTQHIFAYGATYFPRGKCACALRSDVVITSHEFDHPPTAAQAPAYTTKYSL